MGSPTQRSLKKLRDAGYVAEVVEKFNRFAGPHGIRQDLFGFVDVVAISAAGTLGVQTTSYSNMSARIKKIRESEIFPIVLAAGWKVIVHGWRKNKSKRWECVEKEVNAEQ